jgi:hypothetical protein
MQVFKIKKKWLVLMYYGEFTSLKHKNYVEGKKKIWLPWKPRLLFISISQGKNNI